MRALDDREVLNLWERGARLHPLDQGLLALAAALPGTSREGLADWPLGRRNRALAELRRACFGPILRAWVSCGSCGERLEFEMDVRELADGQPAENRKDDGPIVVGGRPFRLPTARDLARAAGAPDPRSAAVRLLETCWVGTGPAPTWSDDEMDEVGQALASADPLAEIRMALVCPSCDHACEETLDIAAFLWAEIEARTRGLLLDVHALASAYGWTEDEILALSEHRRATYVEMARG